MEIGVKHAREILQLVLDCYRAKELQCIQGGRQLVVLSESALRVRAKGIEHFQLHWKLLAFPIS
ncbi:hypothetical protein GCM10011408_35780 [Dyella caseinilytica]|nr:hypothetical protein GCM10011408_35780 [Dyella caseinilytica]